jgi:hypothetical protein
MTGSMRQGSHAPAERAPLGVPARQAMFARSESALADVEHTHSNESAIADSGLAQ